jgi:hypothetical protein
MICFYIFVRMYPTSTHHAQTYTPSSARAPAPLYFTDR